MQQCYVEAYKRLLTLQGVSYGLTSFDDVSMVAMQLAIPDDRIPELIAFLNSSGVTLIPEAQKAQQLSGKVDYYSGKASGYAKYDAQLDGLLASDIDVQILRIWLLRLYKCRRTSIRTVFFMKLAGLTAQKIAAELDVPVEQVYALEYQVLLHYRRTCQTIAHQALSRKSRRRSVEGL
jgi:hypothetical protein